MSVPEASTEPLWSNETSVCLRSLYSLCRSQRGVDVSVSGRLKRLWKQRWVQMHGSSPALWSPTDVDSWAGRLVPRRFKHHGPWVNVTYSFSLKGGSLSSHHDLSSKYINNDPEGEKDFC